MFNLFGPKIDSISMQEAIALKGANIIDVREKNEFKSGSMPGAKNVPMVGLINNPQVFLKKDETYYLLCESGMRSSNTTRQLAKQGYKVINITGGMSAYRRSK